MSKQYPYLFIYSCAVALLAIVFSWLAPQLMSNYEFAIAGVLILALGLPHGATDYLIYRQLSPAGNQRTFTFILGYVLLMAVYGLLWLSLPLSALLLFIVLSIYHFGQSNWANLLESTSKTERVLVHFMWGSFVLGWPLLAHQEKTISILEPLLGRDLTPLTAGQLTILMISLLILNVAWLISARFRGIVSRREMGGELLNLGVLALMFAFTPLLIGFALYFTCWHSLSSIGDQIQFFQQRNPKYDWRNYLRDASPLSVLTLLGLGGWLYFQADTIILETGSMGWLFAFIAMLTLPHMLLIDRLYSH